MKSKKYSVDYLMMLSSEEFLLTVIRKFLYLNATFFTFCSVRVRKAIHPDIVYDTAVHVILFEWECV